MRYIVCFVYRIPYTLLSQIVRTFHFIKRFGVVVDIFFFDLAGQSVMSVGYFVCLLPTLM